MESDDEIEILSYTPLKRKKIGGNDSAYSSQTSVRGNRWSINSGRSQPNKAVNSRKTKLSQRLLHSTNKDTKISFSQVSNTSKSSSLTFKRPFDMTQNKKSPPRKEEHLVRPKSNGTLRLSNKNKSLSTRDSNTNDSQLTEVDLFEEIPDIDFTQFNNRPNDQSETSIEKSMSISSEESQSLLKDYNTGNCYVNNKSARNLASEKNGTANKPKLKKKNLVYSDEPFEEDLSKVSSWLQSSNEYIIPKKVDVRSHDSYNLIEDGSQGSQHENENKTIKSKSIPEKGIEPKACIHLHFHVHSPKKFIQPTLDAFLNSNSVENTKEKENTSQSNGSNGEDVVKTWKTIMNSLKGAAAPLNSRPQKSSFQKSVTAPSCSAVAGSSNESTRKCPFYKCVEDTSFVVDAFSYGYIGGVSAYFLSHFHYDHYRGLHKNFNKYIYCHQITANLVRLKVRVQDQYLRPLPLEEPRIIDGVEVTLYDANHCPGSVMFLFKLRTGKTVLHVGDFRAHADMENICDLWNHSLDLLYLDTTYLDRRYDFFSQEEILEKCAAIAREHIEFNSKTLFVVGSYTIGKEKVFKAIASELNCKIFALPAKQKVLLCLEDDEIRDRMTTNKFQAKVHVVPMSELNPYKLKSYMDSVQSHFKVLVAVKPTGWEHSEGLSEGLENLEPKQNGNIYIYGVPYSEHSSFGELRRFVQFVQARRVIPTVNNGSAVARKRMDDVLDEWRLQAATLFSK